MMFARLFYTSDKIAPMLETATGVGVTDRWPDHSRDEMLYVYMREAEDRRAVYGVERTYLGSRDGVMLAVKNDGENGQEEGEEREGVYVVLSEDEDEDEDEYEGGDGE
jgi:hypothetical protein